jgi:hypothetical protein
MSGDRRRAALSLCHALDRSAGMGNNRALCSTDSPGACLPGVMPGLLVIGQASGTVQEEGFRNSTVFFHARLAASAS